MIASYALNTKWLILGESVKIKVYSLFWVIDGRMSDGKRVFNLYKAIILQIQQIRIIEIQW